jgi:ATP/maltotriose-dependent transcriptional regulator MalT
VWIGRCGDGPLSCARIGDGSFEECRGQGLHISTNTVNTHLRHLLAKLSVSNQVALAAVLHHSIE